MKLQWTGIRTQLVMLVIAMAVPLVTVAGWSVLKRVRLERVALDREIRQSSATVASLLDERIDAVGDVLVGLSATLEFSVKARLRNDTLLASLQRNSRHRLQHLTALDTLGHPVGADINSALSRVAQEDAVRAMRNREGSARLAVVAETAPQSNVLSLRVTHVAVDDRGRARGALVAWWRVDSVSLLVPRSVDFISTSVTVRDSAGQVVARSHGASASVDARDPSAGVADGNAFNDTRAVDGQPVVSSFAQTTTAPLIVSVAHDEGESLARIRRDTTRDLFVGSAVVLTALLLALLIGGRIAKPLDELTADARALTAGSAGHRSRIQSTDEIGVLAGAFNQMAETLERRNALLADSERRYRLMFDSNPLPMWAWDADTMRILAVNEAALEKYGYDRDFFLTRRIVDLLDDAEVDRFNRARLPFSEARQSAGTWTHRTSDGRRMEMEVITTSSRRLGRSSWLSVVIDVTARRHAERALAASEEQLRQSQKMEAIGAFAGGISHDFNNLLTGILGYCDLALLDLAPTDSAHHDVSEIRALSLRGAELTRQILAVSRKQVMQPVLLDANEVVRGLDRLLSRLIGEHIVIETRLGEGIGLIRADAGQLEQVLLNLSANARDAMPTGGTLRVETRVMPQGDAAALGFANHANWMTLRVTDTGCGMPDDVRRRVFEPFFTTKPRGKGTGLGLALAYAMVEQSGGTIHVESMVDIGSTFVLCFPTFDLAAATTSSVPSVSEYLSGTETILLTEDEDSVRAVTTAALERRGYRVLAAADGESALQIARTYAEPIHLLLTDVVMPRMNGRELAEAFERQRPETRVLFASGYTDDASLLHGIRTDELSFLHKPFTATQLLQRVRVALDQPLRVG